MRKEREREEAVVGVGLVIGFATDDTTSCAIYVKYDFKWKRSVCRI